MKHQIKLLATTLDKAAHSAQATIQVSQTQKISLADAYQIQAASLNLRHDRGEILTGFKLGFTSKAKMEQMGVHDIIWGRLTSQMAIPNGGNLQRNQFIHPRAEPEIAFRISKKIDRIIELNEIPDFIDGIAGALEIIDSRYENFKFSLEDVIADNCSSSGYVIGDWLSPNTSVQNLGITLNINGETVQTGNSHAILGNPLESLVEISKMMVRYGETIQPGAIVLAGAATPAVYINEGDKIEGHFEELGTVQFEVI